MSQLCRWFGLAYLATVGITARQSSSQVSGASGHAMIEDNPSFGYLTVAALLGFNKNTVQRIFQLKGRGSRRYNMPAE
ncbi:hypothetical protein ACV1C5_22015 [Aeromonas caviae]